MKPLFSGISSYLSSWPVIMGPRVTEFTPKFKPQSSITNTHSKPGKFIKSMPKCVLKFGAASTAGLGAWSCSFHCSSQGYRRGVQVQTFPTWRSLIFCFHPPPPPTLPPPPVAAGTTLNAAAVPLSSMLHATHHPLPLRCKPSCRPRSGPKHAPLHLTGHSRLCSTPRTPAAE
jgi:hypothetical protein